MNLPTSLLFFSSWCLRNARTIVLVMASLWLNLFPLQPLRASMYEGPLPQFEVDRFNTVKDAKIGTSLRPRLVGKDFEWPSVAQVDWNHDGLFDLIVGYNLRQPDVIRMVVYINQGSVGNPKFLGMASHSTCFYVEAIYPDEEKPRIFENAGYHAPHTPHKFLVHTPGVLDVNNDGLFDILVNEGLYDPKQRRGQWLLLNIGLIGKPRFKAVYLHDDHFEPQLSPGPYVEGLTLFRDLPSEARGGLPVFTLVDWDSDGILDIHYSSRSTYIMFGAKDERGNWFVPEKKWQKQLPTDGKPFGITPHMITADFNGDGINELLVASARDNGKYSGDGFLSLFVRVPASPTIRYAREFPRLFSLNSDNNPWWFYKHGWWHPRIAAIDFDEDGDPDILAGWGGGNDQNQKGTKIYLYRTPGGIPGSHPRFSKPSQQKLQRSIKP